MDYGSRSADAVWIERVGQGSRQGRARAWLSRIASTGRRGPGKDQPQQGRGQVIIHFALPLTTRGDILHYNIIFLIFSSDSFFSNFAITTIVIYFVFHFAINNIIYFVRIEFHT